MSDNRRVKWEQISFGNMETVGYLDSMPVTVSLLYAKINDRIVTFWHSPSMVSDYRLVRKWFNENLPEVYEADAGNFHNVVHHISALNEAQSS